MGWPIKTIFLLICLSVILSVAGYHTALSSFMTPGIPGVPNSGFSLTTTVTNFIAAIIDNIGDFIGLIYNTLNSSLTNAIIGGLIIIGVGGAMLLNSDVMKFAIEGSILAVICNIFLIPSIELINTSSPILPQPWLTMFILVLNVMWLASCLTILHGGDP